MRVLQLSADRGVAPDGTKGASIHLRSLAEAWSRRGISVTMMTHRPPAAGAALPVRHVRGVGRSAILREARSGARPDLIYERYALGHDEGLAAARELGVPLALEVNSPLRTEAERHRPGTVAGGTAETEDRLFREADLVFVVSEPLRDLVTFVRGRRDGVHVVRNGFDPSLVPAAGPSDDGSTLVFLGHPKPWHGADELPAVVRELRERGSPVKLVLIGGGSGADAIRAKATELGVGRHVHVTGSLPQAEAVARLASGTISLAPYPRHAFFYFCPIKVIESMGAGVPVVATALGDIPSIVGDTGIVVSPGDRDAFVGAIHDLLTSPERRADLARRARSRANASLTWDHAAAAVERAARELLATRGSTA